MSELERKRRRREARRKRDARYRARLLEKEDVIASLIKGRSLQAITQPLWSTVTRPVSGESTQFRFARSAQESTNLQLAGALPHPQQFVLEGFELRVLGSFAARALATKFSLSSFEFTMANKIYSELPLGAILWSGALDFPGYRLERELLLDPLTCFAGRIFWKPALPENDLSLTLFLLGTLLRPIA